LVQRHTQRFLIVAKSFARVHYNLTSLKTLDILWLCNRGILRDTFDVTLKEEEMLVILILGIAGVCLFLFAPWTAVGLVIEGCAVYWLSTNNAILDGQAMSLLTLPLLYGFYRDIKRYHKLKEREIAHTIDNEARHKMAVELREAQIKKELAHT
jgi:hypothetical protein